MMKTLGIDSNGQWAPAQYCIDAGWDFNCIEETAKRGISETDAEGLSDEQQAELLAYCRERTA